MWVYIIVLIEIWFDSNILDVEVLLFGFIFFRRDRLVRKGGGVVVFVSELINVVCWLDFEIDEFVWIEIFLFKFKGILFGIFYWLLLELVG